MSPVGDRLATLGYTAAWRTVRAVPKPVATAAFRAGADLAVRRDGAGVRRLAANLRRVVGPDVGEDDVHRLVADGVRSYARYWAEAFRLPSVPADRVVGTFHLENEALLRDAYAAGRGVVLALPHSGNWDHAGAWGCLTGMPITTVAERLRPAALFDRFVAYRESLGFEILPLTGGARPAFEVLSERLRAGRLVVLLADRDLSARGVPVDFFGHPARMPGGPALLSLRTGAPLLVVSLWFDGPLTRARIDGPVEPGRAAGMTQHVADLMAAGIAEHPADWHMLQRLWLDDLADPADRADRDPGDRRSPARPAARGA